MERLETILKAITDAVSLPVMPAPARGKLPCVVYRYYPGESDGVMAKSRLEVRVMHPTVYDTIQEMTALRRALVQEGDSGVLTDEGGTLLICETEEGSGAGYLRGCGMCYLKAGFDICGRA